MPYRLIVTAWLALLSIATAAAPTTAQEFGVISEPPAQRYQFMAHLFFSEGAEREIYLKLDRFTGRTWRFHASNPRWEAVPEADDSRPRGASDSARYELLAHNYFDENGVARELLIRVDAVSGYTWSYEGADSQWHNIPQSD